MQTDPPLALDVPRPDADAPRAVADAARPPGGAKATVLILGKLPPPTLGPAVATQILLSSSLAERYRLLHVDTNVHASLDTLGALSLGKVLRNGGIYARFARLLLAEKPDLVLVPISQSTVGFVKDSVFILLSRMLGRRTLVQLRGSNIQNWLASASAPARAYVEGVIRRAQGAIVLGDNLRPLFAPYFPDERIHVVPNGADYAIPSVSRTTGPVRVLYLANLQPSKGIEDVIEAVALLKARGADGFHLDVVGTWRDDATEASCLARVAEHDLPVTFHGPAYDDDKLAFMARADVFVFTPREPEGHPWVIVEALAAGLPVVSTDQGAIVESVLDGVNGAIVATGAPAEIADRLQRLIEDPALRARQAEASRRHYEAHFTEERMVAQLSRAFDRTLQLA
ncbi:MAG: glycosyltransferase [Rubricoccaceae bacterium]|nr:glycosyltransferase [Rubricoccaceae bacterium]